MRIPYRPEIEGLRALAVIPVIFFHAEFKAFSGGFIGVDIFFVISGYLISSLVISDLAKGNFRLLDFYERRARRILPTLFFVMLACVPLVLVWLLPRDAKSFFGSMAAAVVFSSNFFFWRETSYFETTSAMKPLLHTWSLSVEAQYYILFPFVFLLIWRYRPKLINSLLILAFAISLGLAQWGTGRGLNAPFFLLPTRAWEIILGALCAILLRQATTLHNINKNAKNIAGIAGLLMIAYAIFFFDHTTPTPSFHTLMPTIGAALLVLFAAEGTVAHKILGLRPFVWMGSLSYSAYLIHQPIFAFMKYKLLADIQSWMMAAACAAVIALSFIIYRCIEMPFRDKSRTSQKFIIYGSFLFSTIIISTGVHGYLKDGFAEKYFATLGSPSAKKYYSFIGYWGGEAFDKQFRRGSCFFQADSEPFSKFKKDECLQQISGESNILLLGDSHAAHHAQALANLTTANLLQATGAGCRVLIPAKGRPGCQELANYIFKEYLPRQKIFEAIILAERWTEGDQHILSETLSALRERAKLVIIIGPVPEYHYDLPMLLLRRPELTRGTPLSSALMDRSRLALERAMKSTFDGEEKIIYVSVFDALCESGRCRTVTDADEPMAWDYGHLTVSGSDLIIKNSPAFKEAITGFK
jgi:peptidoglycan/LPS O-acetylase OafA/YrhL